MKQILFVFLDGVGLGPETDSNPFHRHTEDALYRLAHNQRWTQPFAEAASDHHLVRALDATLNVDGLPQSGTGQATLLTGENCARRVGRHFGPFPHSKTHEILDRNNLFHQVQALFPSRCAPAAFANAFPPQYFNAPRRRSTVTTRCCQAAGVEIRNIDAIRDERAISADLTGRTWQTILDLDVPQRTPEEAGTILARTARQHACTLFEYFLTDKVGHRRVEQSPAELLSGLNRFLGGLLDALAPRRDTLLITSDHGNLEDRSHTQHTRNPVPLVVYGWAAPHFSTARTIQDVTPGIRRALRSTSDTAGSPE
jgi:hypothetical protein